MTASRISLGLLVTMAGLNSCGAQPNPRTGADLGPGPRCVATGTTIDSTFLVTQARRALAQPGLALEVSSYRWIRENGVELGLVISLVAGRQPAVVGGGGLVWVDVETGCPIVLRRYE